MSERSELEEQILDKAKRSWNKNEDADGDADVFYSQVVLPLRKLRDAGLFEDLREHRGNYRGGSHVDRVDIIGAINIDWEQFPSD